MTKQQAIKSKAAASRHAARTGPSRTGIIEPSLRPTVMRLLAVSVVLALTYLPWAEWLAVEFEHSYPSNAVQSAALSMMILGTALAVAIVGDAAGMRRSWTALQGKAARMPAGLRVAVAALLTTALGAAFALTIFDGRPVHIDEFAQRLQAAMLLRGNLTWPTPQPPEFFSSLLVVDRGGRSFSQFPPGWAALLALGELLHASWLIAPLCAALLSFGTFRLAQAAGRTEAEAVSAAFLLGLSPWILFQAATQMNHLATAALLVGGSVTLIRAADKGARPGAAAAAGALLGSAGLIRPLEAIAFVVPATAWLAFRAIRLRRSELLFFAGGLAVPAALLLSYNQAVTGHPLQFGYEAQWGARHALGFHEAPWGPAHTPARGLALVHAYLQRMQYALWQTPVPALLLPTAALLFAGKLHPADRYLLSASALLLLGYFLYWHEGEYLGPRFLLPLAPVVMLWVVRLPAVLRQTLRSAFAYRFAVALIVATALAGFAFVPARAREYADRNRPRRLDVDALAAEQGVRGALVLVPSAWSSQLAARLWALAVPRAQTDRLIQMVDRCELDHAISARERNRLPTSREIITLEQLLVRLPARTAGVGSADESSSSGQNNYSPGCRQRVQSERQGSWSLLPFQLAHRFDNIYARDLHELNERLIEQYPGRPLYYLVPDPERGLERPVFKPLQLDSARGAWFLYIAEAMHGW